MRRLTAWTLAATGVLLVVSAASATFPGENGRIAFHAPPAPDARQVELFTIEPDGSDRTRLTHWPDLDSQPAWSPDGSRIAFTRQVPGGVAQSPESGDEIFVVEFPHGRLVRVTHFQPGADFDPAWSPDGSRLVYARNFQLATISVDGGPVSLLTCAVGAIALEPTWSPDGRWIAYARGSQSQGSGIALITPNGEPGPQLTTGHDTSPDWSPDGSRILFVREGNLWAVPAAGGVAYRLTGAPDSAFYAAWSPDGRFVAFTSNRDRPSTASHDLYTVELETGTVRRLTEDGGSPMSPNWQPVGGTEAAPLPPPAETDCDRRSRATTPTPPPAAQTHGLAVANVRVAPRPPRVGRPFAVRLVVRDRLGRAVPGALVSVSAVRARQIIRPTRQRSTNRDGIVSFRLQARRAGRLVLVVRARHIDGSASARRRISVRVAPRR